MLNWGSQTENSHGKIVPTSGDRDIVKCQRCGKRATAERALAKTVCNAEYDNEYDV